MGVDSDLLIDRLRETTFAMPLDEFIFSPVRARAFGGRSSNGASRIGFVFAGGRSQSYLEFSTLAWLSAESYNSLMAASYNRTILSRTI
jgi:hypothetical protein